jgi:hypothetical protein
MFKLFTSHPAEKNSSYIEHARLALAIGLRLALSSVALFTHAVFPFIKIPQYFNLEAMSLYLFDKNIEIED